MPTDNLLVNLAITTDSLDLNMTALLHHFSQYIELSDHLENEIITRVKHQSFEREDFVHNNQKICTHSYFIQQEILRLYFIKDGK